MSSSDTKANTKANTATSSGPLQVAQSFDPATDQLAVTVTPTARAHLARMLVQQGAHAVRLGANESGCNGYMYELTYATNDDDSTAPVAGQADHRFEVGDGLLVIVSARDLPLVQGTRIDYVTEGLNSTLKFTNPNADTHCGCGESFSIAS